MPRILFDQNVPVPLRRFMPGDVVTAFERGWSMLSNGDLLAAAERDAFDVFITSDRNLRYQQNLAGRRIAIVVLPTNDWRTIQTQRDVIAAAVQAAMPGTYQEITVARSR